MTYSFYKYLKKHFAFEMKNINNEFKTVDLLSLHVKNQMGQFIFMKDCRFYIVDNYYREQIQVPDSLVISLHNPLLENHYLDTKKKILYTKNDDLTFAYETWTSSAQGRDDHLYRELNFEHLNYIHCRGQLGSPCTKEDLLLH
jgi:hypothetical protein